MSTKRKRLEATERISVISPASKRPRLPTSRDERAESRAPQTETTPRARRTGNANRADPIATESNGDTAPTPVKRGRGRPRKNAAAQAPQTRELPGDFSDENELAAQDLMDEAEGELDDGDNDSDPGDGATEAAQEDGSATNKTTEKRRRGRPKGSRTRRKASPSPPPDMPPYEQYFFDNRPGGLKASSNTLSAMALLTHEDYYDVMQQYQDPHQDEMDYLYHLHSRAFDQWQFELEEGFSICLYGWGSKRLLLSAFADHLGGAVSDTEPVPKIIMVNGFHPTMTPRDIFSAVASTIPSLKNTKLGAQPADMLSTILTALSSPEHTQPIHVLVHSIDSSALRRTAAQSLLARLAQHRLIRMAFTADMPSFPLLWDARIRGQFNLLFHDATTFQSFAAEIAVGNGGGGVVDEVHSLLGRSGRRVHGREGVVFVLRSLTESARRLFGLLVAEVLSADDDDGELYDIGNTRGQANGLDNGFEQALAGQSAPAGTKTTNSAKVVSAGVEYRALYRKAVAALITSSEAAFRQLLQEFYDHEIVTWRRDAATSRELLALPFGRDELAAIVDDVVVGDI